MVKKKIDPVDGCAYSLAELEAHYARTYKKKDRDFSWRRTMPAIGFAASPRKVGIAYNLSIPEEETTRSWVISCAFPHSA